MLHACVGHRRVGEVHAQGKRASTGCRISDASALGGPAYVYRLTVTTANVPAFHFPLKAKAGRAEGRDRCDKSMASSGRRSTAESSGRASVGEWKVEPEEGHEVHPRPASPTVRVAAVRSGDASSMRPARSSPTPRPARPADPRDVGVHATGRRHLHRPREREVSAVAAGRTSSTACACSTAPEKVEPGFRLTVATDVFTVNRGGGSGDTVQEVERFGGFAGPISVGAADLPKGVTHIGWTVAAGKSDGQVEIIASATAAIGHSPLKLIGNATIGGKSVSVPVTFSGSPDLRLAVAFPTPFKIIDQYVMTSAPRGEVYHRKYRVDRGTFDGPIQVQLADHQARHLQGVTGPVLTLTPGQTEFEYPGVPAAVDGARPHVPRLRHGDRESDGSVDGREHTVSFSSVEQNQQMIVVVGPGRLDVSLEKSSMRARGRGPGGGEDHPRATT